MKTIGDLFSINTRGVSYDDIFVYIQNIYRSSIDNVWSDCGFDISFRDREDKYIETVSMSEIAQVFCQNPNISRDTIIDIYIGDDCVNAESIEFDFSNNSMYLIV